MKPRQRLLPILGVLLMVLYPAAQTAPAKPEPEKLLRIPGATLLVGRPPQRLFLVTGDNVVTVQNNKDAFGWVGPSLSSDGGIVASGVDVDPPERSPRNVIRTYSVREKKWTDHGIVISGSVSISPDGSKLAFQADETTGDPPERVRILNTKTGEESMGEGPSRVRILDLRTGKVTIPNTPRRARSRISWSPDGLKIVLDGGWEPTGNENVFRQVEPSIYVVDLATGVATRIASGISPSWSPSGQWIAFVEDIPDSDFIWRAPRYRVRMIRPDGTGARDIMDFGSWVMPNLQPVWSPDSKSLLLNISNNPDEGTFDIYQVDVETRKRTRMVKGTRDVVFGWVKAK